MYARMCLYKQGTFAQFHPILKGLLTCLFYYCYWLIFLSNISLCRTWKNQTRVHEKFGIKI